MATAKQNNLYLLNLIQRQYLRNMSFPQFKNFRVFSILVALLIFVGCHKDPDPQPDLVADLIGTYKVQKAVTIFNSTISTDEFPFIAGRIIIERSNSDKTRIGVSSFVFSNGGPVSDEQLNEAMKIFPPNNSQSFTFPVTQRNDTIFFTDNQKYFGSFYKDVVTFRYKGSFDNTLTATKVK
ncbi:hypothetical protein [Spirosoma flavum]|uniref:DUF5004 domain-containing protein n=1 Tax=Spirosoma flavum TaxID=2048557 RepID=A0ABW6AIS2_9BACT